jgi:light-regulated signal transduction histidine kinase (bacteriophytochrome)
VAIAFNGNIYSHGIVPDKGDIEFLSYYMATYTKNGSYTTQKLIDLLPQKAAFCSNSSGLIYHSLHSENSDCIMWFRPETQAVVNWAGDPNKAIEKDKNGLSPRKSFEAWKEIVGCLAKPWLKPELTSAAAYAFSLQRQINMLLIMHEEERYRKLSELLRDANSELENINWISTHDLQEPLRKIQLISSRVLAKEDNLSESVKDAMTRMNGSAQRMQTLLIDILKYTRLKYDDNNFEQVDLYHVIDEVKADLAESMGELSAVVTTGHLPQINGIPFLLKQLFSNLIANSVKYSVPGREPMVSVFADLQPVQVSPQDPSLYHLIKVKDNGIGFEQQYAENIFNIFTRLHSTSAYKGSGVGLALCRKIMQNHSGFIAAESVLNEGTTMKLYFPVV